MYGDIKQTDFTIHRGQIDIITGGFPCQPFSQAGKRKGTDDNRYLWPEMLRAIREIQPSYVVGENVSGITNWDGGMVFDQVQSDLENEGFEVLPFLLPACGKNAPHKRERVWFIAHNTNARIKGMRTGRENEIYGHSNTPHSEGGESGEPETGNRGEGTKRGGEEISGTSPDTGLLGQEISEKQTTGIEQCDEGVIANTQISGDRRDPGNVGEAPAESKGKNDGNEFDGSSETITNSNSQRLQVGIQTGFGSNDDQTKASEGSKPSRNYPAGDWSEFPTQPPVCRRDDGIPGELDGITFSKWRNESIKGLGNAIVPQVALEIFKVIEQLSKNSY